MKILGLRFKNLNSLYGEWEIDFTDSEYTSNGIFAITGKTGAGKSTILDAICLALYGSTPRLNSINKSGNEIMSRQTGECYAEVTFKVNSGVYRCHWSQHRARKRADGKLGDSKHEISDVNTGKVLETKKRDVERAVIEKTGMDLDRFTRSILLAQGGFTAFLKATADERAPILEQITGTEIYSTISIKIHERQKIESEKLALLTAETNGIHFLTPQEEDALNIDLNEKIVLENSTSERIQELTRSLTWLRNVESLKKGAESLTLEFKMIQTDLEDLKPKKHRLQLANKAAELDGQFRELLTLREEDNLDNKALNSNILTLPKMEIAVTEMVKELEGSEEKLLKLREEYKVELELIKRVQELDIKIDQNIKDLSVSKSELKDTQDRIDINRNNVKEITDKNASLKTEFKDINRFLEDHDYSALKQQLGEIKLLTEGFANRKVDIVTKESRTESLQLDLRSINGKTESANALLNELKVQSKDQGSIISSQKEKMEKQLNGKLLREYQAELKSLEESRVLLARISSLESARDQLKDGLECPLCGSKDHPYAQGNIPEISAVDSQIGATEKLIYVYNELENNLKKLELDQAEITQKLNSAEKSHIKLAAELSSIKENLIREQDELVELKDSFDSELESLNGILKPHGISIKQSDDTSTIFLDLSKRVFKWESYVNKSNNFLAKTQEFSSKIAQLDAVFNTESINKKQKSEALKLKDNDLENNQLKRAEIYGNKIPSNEQYRLEQQVVGAEKIVTDSRKSNELQSNSFIELKTKNSMLRKRIDQRAKVLTLKESQFIEEYQSRGFLSESVFVNARLNAKERASLQLEARELEDRYNNIITRKNDKEEMLASELKKELTDQSILEVETDLSHSTNVGKAVGGEIGAIREKLENNNQAKKHVDDRIKLIDIQKETLGKWLKLHALIGSADGKKFRNFAQGLTFELMVSHANRQLISMTDRYILVRDTVKPLELNVIDNYQAGEERSTKNLSGGESFIISLSLALGLSNMASNRVKVDSLFLDEGFGTLDEEALETALETLSGLHQSGKLIGIISHIPALKDRISTQIQVSKGVGGRGSISGPGCKKVEP